MRFARDTRMSLEHVWCAFGADDSIEATVLASPSAGRTAMLFASSPHDSEEARLIGEVIRRTCDALDPEDVILAQALVEPSDKLEQEAFVHGGLQRLATLTYMERAMPRRNTIQAPEFPKGISLARYRPEDRGLLEKLLFATYEETLDCPGLAGLRTPSDVVDGHMHSGIFRPQWWVIAHREEQPVGVALFNGSAGASSIELVYLGIISNERGAGLGPALLQHGLRLVSGARERNIVLAVDEENEPALNMYEKAGFHRTIRRTALVRSLDSGNHRDH
jgi:ribosomal protein S18 acetylase RimI-like enzyme